ncbi:MAG: InlB B-repeat-containing protein [Clostridiales bacterium]|nr:InlB B-repeat-containing protein [Clostridiales bacterium]
MRQASVGGHYDVTMTYTFVAPNKDSAKVLAEEACLNDAYRLVFDKSEMDVTLKGDNKLLEPNTERHADFGDTLTKVSGGTSTATQYKATITFNVTVKMETTGAAVFRFIKNGSDIYGDADDTGSLKSKDKAVELSASFSITESAQSAWIIKDDDVKDDDNNNIGLATARNIVTNNGEMAGNFVRKPGSDTEASVYLQNQSSGEISILSPTNIKQFVRADKDFFEIKKYTTVSKNSNLLARDRTTEILSFAGGTPDLNEAGSVTFEVHNVGNEKIATLTIHIYIIDAVTDIIPVNAQQSTDYAAGVFGSIKVTDVKAEHYLNKTPTDYTYSGIKLYYNKGGATFDDATEGGVITFSYNDTPVYKFEKSDGEGRLTALVDIYAFSYHNNVNLGDVEIEFLINNSDEYIGKYYGGEFEYKHKAKVSFVRIADGAALFTDSEYQNMIERDDGFNVSVSQDSEASLYVTSTVNVDGTTVYVERDDSGHIAPVEKATFSLPTGTSITPTTSDSPSQGRYYSIAYRSPAISTEREVYSGAFVYYNKNNTQVALTFTVNNETRKISSMGIYLDKACTDDDDHLLTGKSLLFGGFINQADLYSNTVYVRVAYENHQSSYTSFEGAELSLPSYLKLDGKNPIRGTNTYVLLPAKYSSNNNYVEIFTCSITLDKDEQVTDNKTVKVCPSNNKDKNVVSFTADVQAGLKTLIIKNGDATQSITAGNTGSVTTTFNLKNPTDTNTLNLSFEYGATNSEGYSLSYNHTGAGLNVTVPTAVNGFDISNNIKNATSEFAIASTESIKTGKQKFTLTFIDEYNGADENNVFVLEIEITVTMGIYELAFEDGTDPTVTVTGATGSQALTVKVKYNGNNADTQPSAAVIKSKDVLDAYTFDGTAYTLFTGITVTRDSKDATGKTFTVQIPNNIDRTQSYYLRLVCDGVVYKADDHLRSIKISTLTSHIVFDDGNSVKPTQAQGAACPSASIVVTSASDVFSLKVNVVNDGTNEKEGDAKQSKVVYGLYTDFDCTNEIKTGMTASNGTIKVTNPTKIRDTIYYLAKYTEKDTNKAYELKVALTYTVAPSAVAISGVDANAFDSANDTLTLYYGNANNYTQANLSGKIDATTAFSGASYTTENVTYTAALQNASDSAYLDISGLVLKPIALKNNALTTVPVVVTATYAGVTTDEKVYNVIITPFTTLAQGSGSLSLLNKDAQLTVTPNIATYGGFTHTYTLSAATTDNGVFAINGADDVKTVKLAEGTSAKKGAYSLTETVSYAYDGAANGGITMVGTFESTATYTVTVVGDYELTFDLMAGNNVITPYVNTNESTKYSVVNENLNYSVKVTSADTSFVTTKYGATVTPNVVSVAAFGSGKTATVTLTANASGAFTIAVTATVGGQTYTVTKNYYFVYGANVAAKLYMSQNGSAYTVFNGTEQNIDYTTTPYKFKYEIDGISNDVKDEDIKLVVNGAVTTEAMQKEDSKRYWIITATKATFMRIGASVKIGSRTVYLDEKTVELTATAPDFTLSAQSSVMPSQDAQFTLNKATGFQGNYTVVYAVNSTTYATIDTNGKLTAKTNVVTDQTVIVTATITVSNGVYAGTYTLDKSITVKGVALPTIAFNAGAAREVGIGETDYTRDSYTFNGVVGDYTYSDVSYSLSASSSTLLASPADYELNGNKLTIKNTAKTRAGGSIQLTVTATITSGAHQGESVSDSIIVRVLPTMSTSTSSIALGNAAATYDLNVERFKSTFAPNTNSGTGFVNSTDEYSIVSLSVTDTTNFGVDGAKLIVKNNLTTATTFNVEATVLITSGAYAGTTVVGTKQISISVPPASLEENVTWTASYEYGVILLDKAKVLGNAITGTVSGITVVLPEAVEQYVTVANNGKASPVVSVSKNYGAYFTNDEPTKTFTVNYVVTLTNGNVYYSSAQYTVAPQKVTITAKVGEDTVGGSGYTVNANETFIMQLTADNNFDVVITAVSNSALYNTTFGGNGVQFNVGSVNADQDENVTLTLTVAGQSTTFGFKLNILAPQTNAQYTANNTENTDFAVNDGHLAIDQNNAVASTWTAAGNAQFKYAQKLTITAPNGHYLNEYFDSLKLNNQYSANLNGTSATIDFPVSDVWPYNRREFRTFNLNMAFKTSVAIPLSTIEVKLTVYNRDRNGSYIEVTVLYRIQVTGAIAVTLNTNAGDDTVEVEYSNPLYQHSYSLPTPTRTGYTLDGWYTAEKGGSKVAYNATVTNTQPHTLYAHWTAKTYNLRYNANYTDAPAISDTKIVTYGQTYDELNTPTRPGYDFVGWTAASEANSQVITADTLVKPANANVATITLYAQWRIQYYTVTLNANGGTVGGADTLAMQVAYNGTYNLHTVIEPTRSGYRFDGWYNSEEEKQTAAITVTGNVTLTAQWIPLYTVSFDLNYEGKPAATTAQYANGDTYGTLATPERTGYRFDGWFTEAENGTKVESTTTVNTESLTLYAYWTQMFTVTLTLDGGNIGGETTYSFTVAKDTQFSTYRNITPMRDGYRFDGWTYNNAPATEAIEVTDDVTLTAQWVKRYTVTFVNIESDETPDEQQYDEGAEYDLPTLQDTDTKHFEGWSLAANGEVIDDTSTVGGDNANITLYAIWTDLTPEIGD